MDVVLLSGTSFYSQVEWGIYRAVCLGSLCSGFISYPYSTFINYLLSDDLHTVFLLESAAAAAGANAVDDDCDTTVSDNRCLSWLCHCHPSVQLGDHHLYM